MKSMVRILGRFANLRNLKCLSSNTYVERGRRWNEDLHLKLGSLKIYTYTARVFLEKFLH